MISTNDQQTFDVKGAAAYLHVQPSYLYKLVEYGKITYSKPTGRRLVFRLKDLDRFIDRGRCKADYDLEEEAEQKLLEAAGR